MKFLTGFRVLLAFALLAPFATRADEVDDYVKAQMNKQHIPGLSLAVVKNGHIEKSAGYGLANEIGRASCRERVVNVDVDEVLYRNKIDTSVHVRTVCVA